MKLSGAMSRARKPGVSALAMFCAITFFALRQPAHLAADRFEQIEVRKVHVPGDPPWKFRGPGNCRPRVCVARQDTGGTALRKAYARTSLGLPRLKAGSRLIRHPSSADCLLPCPNPRIPAKSARPPSRSAMSWAVTGCRAWSPRAGGTLADKILEIAFASGVKVREDRDLPSCCPRSRSTATSRPRRCSRWRKSSTTSTAPTAGCVRAASRRPQKNE